MPMNCEQEKGTMNCTADQAQMVECHFPKVIDFPVLLLEHIKLHMFVEKNDSLLT
jgi:hypothetical protein